MCKIFSKFSREISAVDQKEAEIEKIAESAIEEINKDTNNFLELNKQCAENDKKKIEKISEKIKVSIDENDMTSLDSQINDMMSLLDEDKEQLVKQKISDSKLKSANI